ncbi:hypothetical protein L3X38_009547 [Prunus dulcis]|uniref:Uncharacterized protein n=1 Tax=Prunus dulcis TaxID=3755 RepID=A0AAD4WGI5_PRUDU|nr:hypothetical protein L3X38_009547 [Prunus dulcis]
MQWTMAELINHPDIFNKVRQAIKSVVGNSRLVGETDIPNLPYLQAVVKESLRLYPPCPVVIRKCRQNCKIKGFDIPPRSYGGHQCVGRKGDGDEANKVNMEIGAGISLPMAYPLELLPIIHFNPFVSSI